MYDYNQSRRKTVYNILGEDEAMNQWSYFCLHYTEPLWMIPTWDGDSCWQQLTGCVDSNKQWVHSSITVKSTNQSLPASGFIFVNVSNWSNHRLTIELVNNVNFPFLVYDNNIFTFQEVYILSKYIFNIINNF